eukprot:3130928-Amphidinium_carterae.1
MSQSLHSWRTGPDPTVFQACRAKFWLRVRTDSKWALSMWNRHIFSLIDTTSTSVTYLVPIVLVAKEQTHALFYGVSWNLSEVRGSFLEIYNEEIRDLLSRNPKDASCCAAHP